MCILCWIDKNNEKKWFKFDSKDSALEYVKMYKINDYFIAYEDYKLGLLKNEVTRLTNLLHTIYSMIESNVEI